MTGDIEPEDGCCDKDVDEDDGEAGESEEADDDEPTALVERFGLRYFSPKEIARLHCFPTHFSFPKSIDVKQQWKCLGNSMCVGVVAEILIAGFGISNMT